MPLSLEQRLSRYQQILESLPKTPENAAFMQAIFIRISTGGSLDYIKTIGKGLQVDSVIVQEVYTLITSEDKIIGNPLPISCPLTGLEIQYINSYTKHGCNIQGQLGLIEYNSSAKHGFNSAYRSGGMFDWFDKAKTLAEKHHPDMAVILGIPDLVFSYGNSK